jgi:hypothetical protein
VRERERLIRQLLRLVELALRQRQLRAFIERQRREGGTVRLFQATG